jgi:hypothetical protein
VGGKVFDRGIDSSVTKEVRLAAALLVRECLRSLRLLVVVNVLAREEVVCVRCQPPVLWTLACTPSPYGLRDAAHPCADVKGKGGGICRVWV